MLAYISIFALLSKKDECLLVKKVCSLNPLDPDASLPVHGPKLSLALLEKPLLTGVQLVAGYTQTHA